MKPKIVYRWWWKNGEDWEPISWADDTIREANVSMNALQKLPREWKLVRETTTYEDVK